MNKLPNLRKLVSTLVLSATLVAYSTSSTLAASAYINPSQGKITSKNFLVSVYVESSVSEPQIASTELKITYPATVKVVSIAQGEFDSYLDKSFDTTTSTITIKAVNNAGNYKSGKVKVAGINFETVTDTGAAKLTIDPTSKISGAGGEELLTETIDSNYTLAIESTTEPTPTPSVSITGTTTTGNGNGTNAPETGVNDVVYYAIISSLLLAGGIYLAKTSINLRK